MLAEQLIVSIFICSASQFIKKLFYKFSSDSHTYRGKYSVAIDMATEEEATTYQKMVLDSDVLIENYKVGSLKIWSRL